MDDKSAKNNLNNSFVSLLNAGACQVLPGFTQEQGERLHFPAYGYLL